jgi:hypothetical protein
MPLPRVLAVQHFGPQRRLHPAHVLHAQAVRSPKQQRAVAAGRHAGVRRRTNRRAVDVVHGHTRLPGSGSAVAVVSNAMLH